jgi:hypothetical protein
MIAYIIFIIQNWQLLVVGRGNETWGLLTTVTGPNFIMSVSRKTYMIGLLKNKLNNKFVFVTLSGF